MDVYSSNKSTLSILHAADDLVDEELDVVVGKLLRLDDVVQVSSHQVGHLETVDWVRKRPFLPCRHQQTGQVCSEV